MQPISYARHRFPADIIRHAVWLYLRFTLSYRDVEELLAERGLSKCAQLVPRMGLGTREMEQAGCSPGGAPSVAKATQLCLAETYDPGGADE